MLLSHGRVFCGLETEVGSQGVTGRFRKVRQAVGVLMSVKVIELAR